MNNTKKKIRVIPQEQGFLLAYGGYQVMSESCPDKKQVQQKEDWLLKSQFSKRHKAETVLSELSQKPTTDVRYRRRGRRKKSDKAH